MWVNGLWLEKAELASLSVLAQRQQYSVPVSCLPFLNPDQIFLLLMTAESSGQVLQTLPNQKVKLSCCFDLLQLALSIDGFHHCSQCPVLLGLMNQKFRLSHCLRRAKPFCLPMIFTAHTWSLYVMKYFVRLWRSSCQKELPISEFLCFIAKFFSCA